MPIDLGRTVRELADAALREAVQPEPKQPKRAKKAKKPLLSTGRAMLLGAGLVTAGRALAGSRGRHMLGSLQEALAEHREHPDDDEPGQYDDEPGEYEDDEPGEYEDDEAREYEDDEPLAEAEEDEPPAEAEEDEPPAEDDEDVDEVDAEEPEPPPKKPRRRSPSRGRA